MTELLAPAGSVEALHSAINAGCDAIYIGGKMFGARAYADNPDCDELLKAIDHCHVFDKKIYLTVNTLLKNDELTENLYEFLRPYYAEGLDGVIVSDMGVMKAISLYFPDLPIHISTQASVTAAEGAEIFRNKIKGITRVVPARELTIDEIELFKKKTDLEVEVFVHGAMCVCYSGQCLMSSIAGGRSGNRGRCAQPCRKNYDTGINDSFILSCKDMCTIPAIGRLMRAGVDSFKIEGRMKSPIYVAATVATYRKYMDIAYEKGDAYEAYLSDHTEELEKDINMLREIYNRGGFCTGFLLGGKNLISTDKASHNGVNVGCVRGVSGREATIEFNDSVNPGDVIEIRRDDGSPLYEFTSGSNYTQGSKFKILVSKGQKALVGQRVFRVKNNSLINQISEKYIENPIKRKIGITFEARVGEPLKLSVYPVYKGKLSFDINEDESVTLCGACPEKAITASANAENIRKHLYKTGESVFDVAESDIILEDGLFIPVGAVNTLRREAIEALERKLVGKYIREVGSCEVLSRDMGVNKMNGPSERHALVSFIENLKPVLENREIKRIYLPLGPLKEAKVVIDRFMGIAAELERDSRELYIALPYICRNRTLNEIKELKIIERLGEKCGFLVRNNEELSLLCKSDHKMILDHTMHIFNRYSAECYGGEFTFSPELNRDELMNFGDNKNGELVIYGRLPLMQTAHCVYKNEGLECIKGRNEGTVSESFIKLKDSKGYVFPVIRSCEYCTNIILNSSILDLRDMVNDINEIGPGAVRYDFTFESEQEIDNVLKGYKEENEYTFGHFKRGVL